MDRTATKVRIVNYVKIYGKPDMVLTVRSLYDFTLRRTNRAIARECAGGCIRFWHHNWRNVGLFPDIEIGIFVYHTHPRKSVPLFPNIFLNKTRKIYNDHYNASSNLSHYNLTICTHITCITIVIPWQNFQIFYTPQTKFFANWPNI